MRNGVDFSVHSGISAREVLVQTTSKPAPGSKYDALCDAVMVNLVPLFKVGEDHCIVLMNSSYFANDSTAKAFRERWESRYLKETQVDVSILTNLESGCKTIITLRKISDRKRKRIFGCIK